uniref:Uncharacterized protein n=1 Tax=Nothobranchius furzeri TaxID=105023 RepID=A0A8C6PAG5_NOTFU
MPKRRALARAIRRLANALKFFSSSEITRAFSFLYSVDLLRRRESTEMPIVRAVFLWIPAACRTDSSRVKPRPARTLVWYLTVGHLTCGRTRLSPAFLPGRLVEPGAHSFLPVFVEMRVQNHSIPAWGHGCLIPCNTPSEMDMNEHESCRQHLIQHLN